MAESKFGFEPESQSSTDDLALEFTPVPVKRSDIDLVLVDEAAKLAGFESREPKPAKRRRRYIREQRSRYLAIRLTEQQYERFLGFADAHQETYSEAVMHLIDIADGQHSPKRAHDE